MPAKHNQINKDRIAKLLRETELTQQEIADIVGCSATVVKGVNKDREIRTYKPNSCEFEIREQVV